MALGTLRYGVVKVGNGLQDNAELGHEGLNQEGMRDDHPLIGGQRSGTLDGLDAPVDDVAVAHVMGGGRSLPGSCGVRVGPL